MESVAKPLPTLAFSRLKLENRIDCSHAQFNQFSYVLDIMNNRQRFNATMHYQPRDRAPIADFGFWEETIVIWHEQGLPDDIYFDGSDNNTVEFFGMDFGIDRTGIGVESGLFPAFEEKVIQDHGNRIILQQADGVIVERDRFMSSIPKPVSHSLKDRATWQKHFLPRLDPENPGRFPKDWDAQLDGAGTAVIDGL
jgi:hypothetical protein